MSDYPVIKLLGDILLTQNGTIRTESLCEEGKYLGLYYSAQWCPSCIAFTPELTQFYRQFKASNRKEKIEIIYISSDSEEKQFKEQFAAMPWLALPFSDRHRQMELARHFRVQSIPALVIIDSLSAELITSCGRACVMDDPGGLRFPWPMRDPVEVLKECILVSPNGDKVSYESISTHIKGLYFSAHWCPPCKAFTPQLIKLYNKVQNMGKNFQIIFVSSDRSEESFVKYFSNMPWLAVPYSEEKTRKELAHLYGVGGIPCLVILDENNSIITKEGRMEVNEDPEGEEFPWRPKLVDELGSKHVSKLNEEPCLVYFTICEDKELELAHFALLPVAEEYQARIKRASAEETKIPKLNFFYAGDADICDSVRDIIGFGDDFPLLVILDIPNGKKYIHERSENMTSDMIGKFVRDFISQKLKSITIGN
ncbi:nucleoredoxin [Trichonephila clavata]|uniref:Nucleoredoxin n=1 Tax=Trichonephila clavata TaxID=2740835 RepID=A0A8X6HXE8_TRICU|nr:nucleoredoxin [Trichonephila clavata]